MAEQPASEHAASVVIPCQELTETIERYEALGFLLRAIGPADEPSWAELDGLGLNVVLDTTRLGGPVVQVSQQPDGEQQLPPFVELQQEEVAQAVPDTVQSLAIAHESAEGWIGGRAGMQYRDLIPDRHGGAYIASHIHIPVGGPVPDYVHHHDVSHQLIFCHRGWVRVVYQDQGPAFVMEPGDCVLQPPGIRHRVLEASDDLFVTEVTCPAVHRTYIEHDLDLPNAEPDKQRTFGGQRFVRHIAALAPWASIPDSDFEAQVTAIADATEELAAVRLIRARSEQKADVSLAHDEDLLFLFVVSGTADLVDDSGQAVALHEGSSVAIPTGRDFALAGSSAGTTLLELRSRRPQ